MTIEFCRHHGEYGFLSNFYQFGFELDDKLWMTVEHYYQAQKYAGTELEEQIRLLPTPYDTKKWGKLYKVRSDWGQVKEEVMLKALFAKFSQEPLKSKLLATGEEEIIEAVPWDSYWGIGKDGKGQNRLGILLMQIREAIKDEG